MSIQVWVHSERNLRQAIPYIRLWCGDRPGDVRFVVVAEESRVLKHQAERIATELMEQKVIRQCDVQSVASELADAKELMRQQPESAVLLMDDEHRRDLMAKLFQISGGVTLWLKPAFDAEDLPERVFFRECGAVKDVERLLAECFGEAGRERVSDGTLLKRTAQDTRDEKSSDADSAEDEGSSNALPELTGDEVLVFAFSDVDDSQETFREAAKRFQGEDPFGLALVHDGHGVSERFSLWIQQRWASVAPPMSRPERRALAEDLESGSNFNIEFLGLMSASAMLAGFGLIQDSAAVIIGAMLIAPLMTPIMGAGLAISQGNQPLFRRAIVTIAMGFAGAMFAAFAFGLLYRLLVPGETQITGEMLSRCRPTTIDFCVGLVGGLAASYARTRTHLSAALAGSAIAAALVPPIATAGLHLAFRPQSGLDEPPPVLPPILLVCINVLMIMIGSSFILWARGMRSDTDLGLRARWTVRMAALLTMLGLAVFVWNFQRNHPTIIREVIRIVPAVR